VCQISKLLATKSLSLSENALNFTYGNAEFQSFPRDDPRTPASRGGKGRGGISGREGWWGGEGGGWGGRKGRGGREGLKEWAGMKRGEKGAAGKRNLDPRSARQIDATDL
jgi:hypothetical protein